MWFSVIQITCQGKQQMFVNRLSVSLDFTAELVNAVLPDSLTELHNFESC